MTDEKLPPKTTIDLQNDILKEDPDFINVLNKMDQQIIATSNVVSILKPYPELESVIPVSIRDVISEEPKKIEHILYPWLPNQGIAFIYAATGVGKTLFTLNVAYAIAGGGDFLKYKCPAPKKVLYIDGEMSYPEMHSRIMQVVKQQGELHDPDNFQLFTPDKVFPRRLPKICDKFGQEFYMNVIKKFGIEVLILDNLSTLSAIDENKSDEWKIIQDWLIQLRSQGITVIVVHHAGKDKFGYRGTSRMLDCVDTAISLQTVCDNQLEHEISNIKKFKISYQKARSFNGENANDFEAILMPSGWEFKSIEKTTTQRIIEMLKLNMTHKEIAQELGFHRSYISKLVKKAITDGLIRIGD